MDLVKNKIIEILKDKKKMAIMGVSLLLLISGSLFLALRNNEEKLASKLEELGRDYYENYYYDKTGATRSERIKFVQKYRTLGVKITLDNLKRYNDGEKENIVKQFVNKRTKQTCDLKKSFAIVYPTGAYEKTDYKIEVKLECGF